jgi:hypothetical protein
MLVVAGVVFIHHHLEVLVLVVLVVVVLVLDHIQEMGLQEQPVLAVAVVALPVVEHLVLVVPVSSSSLIHHNK